MTDLLMIRVVFCRVVWVRAKAQPKSQRKVRSAGFQPEYQSEKGLLTEGFDITLRDDADGNREAPRILNVPPVQRTDLLAGMNESSFGAKNRYQ